jgi:hypothetical protein
MTTASLVIKFTNPEAAAASNAHLSAEVDARPTGLNAGKNTFIPGSTAHVLIYKTANVTLLPAESSAGSFNYGGTASVQLTDELQFSGTDTATLRAPLASLVSYKWIGRDLGTPTLAADGMTVTVPSAGVGILSVTYHATAIIGSLVSPTSVSGEIDFSVIVLIKGEVTV